MQHTRRAPRIVLAGLVAALAVAGLAGCRTSPNVAAYVGDQTITVAELDSAVDHHLADKAVAAGAKGKKDQLVRGVLGLMVDREVYTQAARRYGVQVSDADVRQRLDELLQGQDAQSAFSQAAAQGLTRDDVLERIREQLIGTQVAVAAGKGDALSEQALRASYQKALPQLTQTVLGLITVPDQATADAVLAQLVAAPAGYAPLAAQYAGQNTLPEPQAVTADQLTPDLASRVASTAAGQGFTLPLPQGAGVAVVLVSSVQVPTFEQARPQLEQQASTSVDKAATGLVDDVRKDLDIRVNPRYGQLDGNHVVPLKDGAVDILGGSSSAASPSSTTGG